MNIAGEVAADVATASDLWIEYDGRPVLAGVDVRVRAGEQLVVTGRSGSGKTTLLLALAGLLPATRGTTTLGAPTLSVMYVPQAPSLLPDLTALENASLGLRVRGVQPRDAGAQAARQLERLGLADAADSLPAELSGGMQQRVALARALLVAPDLLLADEPTGALDRSTGRAVLTLLRETCTEVGSALVVATHDRDVAESFPRRLALEAGQLREAGP